METRAKNKTSHPGYVDLLHPPNSDTPTVPEKTTEEKAREEANIIQAAKNVASIQDILAREDAMHEASHQAEHTINKAKGEQFVTICGRLMIVYYSCTIGMKA